MALREQVKTAVIGVGYLGRFHAQKLKQIVGSELVGVFDAQREQCLKVAAELSVKPFSTLDECLSECEAVVVATSTPYHADVVKKALLSGKHVLVEKPMTEWAKQGKELVQIAESKNLVFAVGQIERFNPCFQWLNENVFLQRRSSDGEKVLSVELFRLAPFRLRGSDVSVVQDLLIHDIDLVSWLMEHRPIQIVGVSGQRLMSEKLDYVQAHLTHHETSFYIHVNRTAPQISRFARVVTNRRVIEINSQTMEVQISTYTHPKDEQPCVLEKIQIEKKDALLSENANFIGAVLGREQLLCSGVNGLSSLQICEEIETRVLTGPS